MWSHSPAHISHSASKPEKRLFDSPPLWALPWGLQAVTPRLGPLTQYFPLDQELSQPESTAFPCHRWCPGPDTQLSLALTAPSVENCEQEPM